VRRVLRRVDALRREVSMPAPAQQEVSMADRTARMVGPMVPTMSTAARMAGPTARARQETADERTAESEAN
jgi:Ni,Fe-hydrogenase III large subunit